MKKLLILTVAILAGMALTANAEDGKTLYEKRKCAQCHGPDGKGETKMGKKQGVKDYTSAKVQTEMKDAEAFKAIKEGLKRKDGTTLMKPTEGVTDDDIKALVKHMRSFKK
jgi:cytochrome c551/c552